MRSTYLVLAIVGGIVPYVFFLEHFGAAGTGLGTFVRGLFANGAAGGFSADLLISSLVFWSYLLSRKVAHAWLYIVVNLTIGLSCALPLYLYRTAPKAPAPSLARS